MDLLTILFFVYAGNMVLCAVINIINGTRVPSTLIEFVKMTFFPWLLIMVLFKNEEIKLR